MPLYDANPYAKRRYYLAPQPPTGNSASLFRPMRVTLTLAARFLHSGLGSANR